MIDFVLSSLRLFLVKNFAQLKLNSEISCDKMSEIHVYGKGGEGR